MKKRFTEEQIIGGAAGSRFRPLRLVAFCSGDGHLLRGTVTIRLCDRQFPDWHKQPAMSWRISC